MDLTPITDQPPPPYQTMPQHRGNLRELVLRLSHSDCTEAADAALEIWNQFRPEEHECPNGISIDDLPMVGALASIIEEVANLQAALIPGQACKSSMPGDAAEIRFQLASLLARLLLPPPRQP